MLCYVVSCVCWVLVLCCACYALLWRDDYRDDGWLRLTDWQDLWLCHFVWFVIGEVEVVSWIDMFQFQFQCKLFKLGKLQAQAASWGISFFSAPPAPSKSSAEAAMAGDGPRPTWSGAQTTRGRGARGRGRGNKGSSRGSRSCDSSIASKPQHVITVASSARRSSMKRFNDLKRNVVVCLKLGTDVLKEAEEAPLDLLVTGLDWLDWTSDFSAVQWILKWLKYSLQCT